VADLAAIGKRIRERRTELKLGTRRLAALVGVSHDSIARWERGEAKTIDSDKLERVAEALDMAFGYLLYGDETRVLTSRDEKRLEAGMQRNEAFAISGARSRARLTQSELAEKVGVDPSVISRIEDAEERPAPRLRARLEEVLGVKSRIVEPTIESYLLLLRTPMSWPSGLQNFVGSASFDELKLRPVHAPILAAAAVHPEYWKPASEEEWGELARALLRDFETVRFIVIPDVEAEMYKNLRDFVAQARHPEALLPRNGEEEGGD
jgi:transcriptional regulator with XRE-family HTH domain